jgi:hypothetical protein
MRPARNERAAAVALCAAATTLTAAIAVRITVLDGWRDLLLITGIVVVPAALLWSVLGLASGRGPRALWWMCLIVSAVATLVLAGVIAGART